MNSIDVIIQKLCDENILQLMEQQHLQTFNLKVEKVDGAYSAITTSIKEDTEEEEYNNLTITKFIKNKEVE